MSKLEGGLLESLSGLEKDLKNTVINNVLDKTINQGLAAAKKNTPVGVYDKHVSFTTKDGKNVEFDVKAKRIGGTLRRNWKTSYINKNSRELYNNIEYALYVDQGHRIVSYVEGMPIERGWVNGKFMLAKAEKEMERVMPIVHKQEIERIKKKYGF